MKLLILADIHGTTKYLSRLADEAAACDAIVLAGDITNFGGRDDVVMVLNALESFKKPIIAVPGNCDLPVVDHELQARNYSVHANVVRIGDFAYLGAGGSLPCPGTTPNEAGEGVFRDILEEAAKLAAGKGADVGGQQGAGEAAELAAGKSLVLVTHQPAWNTKLDTAGDRHTGSRAIREFIENHKPVLAVSGHMHEALGTDQIGPTTLVNPGPWRSGRYAVADLAPNAVTVDLRTTH